MLYFFYSTAFVLQMYLLCTFSDSHNTYETLLKYDTLPILGKDETNQHYI